MGQTLFEWSGTKARTVSGYPICMSARAIFITNTVLCHPVIFISVTGCKLVRGTFGKGHHVNLLKGFLANNGPLTFQRW